MIKNLQEHIADRRRLAERVNIVLQHPQVGKRIFTFWYDIMERALADGYEIKQLPDIWIPRFEHSWDKEVNIPISVTFGSNFLTIPYKDIIKMQNAYMYDDTVKWAYTHSFGDMSLCCTLTADIPTEDLELLTDMGVRKVSKQSYKQTSYVCALPDKKEILEDSSLIDPDEEEDDEAIPF